MLSWHKRQDGWSAWAPRLLPDDKMPPRYRLTVIEPRSPKRKLELLRHGKEPKTLATVANLAAGKERAAKHYMAHQERT